MKNKENTDLGIIAQKTIAFYYRLCYYRYITKGKVMTIKVEHIEIEETLYRDIRVPYIKLVAIHKSCPF